jgi:hypothetical protein
MAMGKYAERAQQFAEEVARSIEDKKAREAADVERGNQFVGDLEEFAMDLNAALAKALPATSILARVAAIPWRREGDAIVATIWARRGEADQVVKVEVGPLDEIRVNGSSVSDGGTALDVVCKELFRTIASP